MNLPPAAKFRVIKAGQEEDEAAAAAAKKKKSKPKKPAVRPPADVLSFRGDSYGGVHVYM